MGVRRKSVLFTTVLLACINCSYGCAVTGAITPTLFLTSFRDVDRGTIIDTGTTNIIGMQIPNYGVDLGGTPYIVITFENNRVVVVTNHNYGDYEKYETATFISADVTFTCAPGSPQTSLTVTFRIDVVDTNNNAPEFIPSSGVVYTISTPVPPYYEITGCGNEIVVRDIDLTTNAVHFTVDNPDFEIQSVVPTERPKEFKAMLRTTTLIRSIPEDIVLRITATDEDLTGDPPLTTETMITIAGNRDFLMPDELGFSQTFYQHNYDINNNAIVPSQPIVLENGFDDKVDIFLYGGLSNHFKLDTNGNTATLRLETALPDSVFSNQYIFFEVRAEREDTIGTAATIIIQLPEARELMFEESSYRGSIQNNDIALGNIRLAVGYDEKVKFDLHGEFSTHFTLNDEKNGQVTLNVNPTIPENVILENNLIYLTVTASGVNAITTTTSILLDIIKADHTTPVFSRNIYYGTYLGNTIDIQNINLIQGFDKYVKFRLDGEHSNYFQISGEDNDMQLTLRPENIPEDVIFNEKVLVFNVLAEKALTVGAHAVIVIRFPPDLTNTAIMSFSQNAYLGKYENNELEVDQVVLTSGYAPGTEFIITGEYETYFQRSVEENTVSLALDKTLPTDTIPGPFIVLEIEARRERAASVWTSVIINIVEQEIVHPVFTNAYYVGIYNADTEVLQFDEIISLFSGFDDTVTFHLEGEHSDLFRLVPGSDTNSYKIDTKESLPKDLLLDRGHIILTVLARKPGANAAHSAIVIEIKKESLQSPIIRFERVSYVGSIENNLVNLVPIRLTEGYTDDVQFALHGALSEYFTIPNDGPVINLQLPTSIPADLIPASSTIVLDIRASLPETATTFATIVLDVITENDENPAVQLGFDAVYYTGSYGTSGLSMDSRIVLSEGFEEGVHFSLEGANAQWFRVVPTQNVATLVVQSGIPEAVLISNQQLVFTIKAERLGSITAQAAVVISLPDENLETSTIGFERVSYVGSIENNVVNLVPITLTEGYTNDVQLALYGALSEYFTIPNDGPVIDLQLPTPIPTDLIPASGTIVLDIRASLPETATTFATIVLDVITENDDNPVVQLGFDAVYYTGSYGTTGLSMDSRIVLSEGFEEGVHFSLEGADAQWFRVVPTQNVATLVVQSGIPEAVLVSNQQLVFTIKAERLGSITAQAAIVISLPDENLETSTIGFERVSYVGSIENNVVNLVPITLTEGYTNDVQLALYGALSEYFTIPNDGPVINLQLPTPIPTDLIPASGTIVLDIRASLPETATTFATIVLNVITENDENPAVQLGFDAVYYTGSYGTSGLSMNSRIVLSEGFEEGVHFSLEGADAQWFRVVPAQNVATLVVQSGIPEAVLISNQQLVFTIKAERLGSITAQAAVVISLPDENLETSTIGFERVSYVGSIEKNVVNLVPIRLTEGYTDDIQLALYGALSEYFTIPNDGPVINLQLPTPIPADLIPASGTIVLDIRASLPETATTFATIVLDVITENDENPAVQLGFDAVYYTGSYGTSGLSMDSRIVLSEGFEEGVHFSLEGADAQWFRVVPTQNVATLVVQSGIPEAVLVSNQQLVFTIKAERLGSITAQAAIVISLPDENLETSTIGFERVSYVGSIENNVVNLVPITLTEGYTNDVQLALYGALSEYFTIPNDGPVINLQLPTPIPTDLIPASGTIVLDIRASLPETATTFATIVLDVITENNENPAVQLGFDAVYYTGSYGTTGLSMESRIVLSEGFEEGVHFSLEGADAQWFRVVPTQNVATLVVQSGIPEAVLISNQQLVFTIKAERLGSITAQATVVISLPDDNLETSTIGFERVSYVGSIENNVVNLMPIRLTDGYTNDVQLALYGALSEYFTIPNDGPVINLQLPTPIPADLIPASGTIVLDIRASLPETATTFATIVLDVITENDENPAVQLGFDAVYYTGSYGTSGLSMDSRIVLSEGFEEGVHFSLEGADAQWFRVVPAQNVATLVVQSGIPEAVLISNQQLVFTIKAERPGSITARAAIVISLPDGSQSGENLTFEKVLYRGSIQDGQVDHEDIIVSGFDGTTVTIIGEHSGLFEATATNGMVTVKAQGSLNLPAEITRVDLELRAGTARAVLLLNVGETDPVPAPPPTVTFTSDSYAVSVEIVQTGIIGRVLATSDNEEPITYSLSDLNAHLQSRLSINNEGELFLSAPANSGVYTFRVIATTDTTEATATATVHLTVQAITTCGDEIVVPPLITLDRDEEEPHNKLVVLQPTLHAGCHFTLNSLYPSDQDWLFVDDNGLHARVIDREHPSIAFMTLSQVQVELILHCESDNNIRTKRSERTDWFSEIDYGTKNWILTDSIPYNSRRSLVNLIVNDINDNDPIFVGKEHEPIAVGYPIDELEERILPRSLAELKATDADIGWNAKLRYWSSESVLAVAPTTGFVHVQSSASLVNNQILTVHATDRNGEGNSGSIQLVVKLLTANNIAVVTVKNSFLDQEASILERLSAAVGYDVKTLRSEVISEDADPGRQDSGASLQLYVYGLISREPVAVELLVENINSNSEIVNVISTVSLEDHLEDIIVIQRNNGLLASTIALSILLFILMVLIAVWYYLRWRKNKSYDQFSDKNSIASRNESLGDLSKPAEIPPVPLQPRLNIDDLKKSERRLQEMLDAPIEAVTVEPVPSRSEPTAPPLEAILDISMPEINVPIVIQSIDKLKDAEESDDEFGEVGEVSKTPRKSVVTFNENVEKIIHVEDDTDNSSQSGYEIYKF
ncbi:uncharacterized protein LOC113502598 isoform X10 [Trichoplusia ni]|uniref:Uncharacterized protein LOC113502598 isoform X10 n=1 Tax=Trichoplusia ni TaxID=7111 RepID=A0A7E5WIS0_TRINI|nr:uncharacterized protein LOC113502598 isoform X10 [Trichoplusia ni]